jgi:hypothetical protein
MGFETAANETGAGAHRLECFRSTGAFFGHQEQMLMMVASIGHSLAPPRSDWRQGEF